MKIASDKVDRVTELVGSVAAGQAGWTESLREIEALEGRGRALLRHLARAAATSGRDEGATREQLARLAGAARDYLHGREELESATTRVLARAHDAAADAALGLDELESRVRDLRLVPISSLLARYSRAVRDLAREQGKLVVAVVKDTQAEADKQVLDELDAVLLHLVRNAVDHGIESTDERRRAGKAAQAKICLSATQRGSSVVVVVSDDGRGIHRDAIVAAAVARGLVSEDEGRQLTPAAVHELLFRPGFSTRASADELSGRGVGLDVVRQRTMALGGSVRVESEKGVGTRFEVVVPVGVALLPALIVHAGGASFAVPSDAVECVIQVGVSDVVEANGSKTVRVGDDFVPLFDMASVLGLDPGARTERSHVLLLRHEARRVALATGSVDGERKIVQHPLDGFLSNVKVLSGTAMLEGHEVLLVLNVPHLVRLTRRQAPAPARSDPARGPGRTVLVVDDSEMVRDMLVGILRARGYRVIEGVDGRDALARLAHEMPDLVMTDLDMPGLDGFGLLEQLRARPETARLPVVVLTSRESVEHKQRALQLGADAYVTKGEFREADLMFVVERFLSRSSA